MTCQYIEDLMEKGAKIIDVRTQAEHAAGAIKNSVNIPLNAFHLVDNFLSEDDTILLYCRSGARSESAKNYLVERGFNAINIGGINQYMGCLV